MRKFYSLTAIAAVTLVLCLSLPRTSKAVPISDENRRELVGVFEGLKPKPFLANARGILKAANQKSCGKKSQPIANIERIRSWFAVSTVSAQGPCPDCFPSTDKCSGQYMYLTAQACISGCSGNYNKA